MGKTKRFQGFGVSATTLLEMVEGHAERFAGRTAAVFPDADGNAAAWRSSSGTGTAGCTCGPR